MQEVVGSIPTGSTEVNMKELYENKDTLWRPYAELFAYRSLV